MTAQSIARSLFAPCRLLAAACMLFVITVARSESAQPPYSFLQPGFTQELVGATQLPAGQIFGGVAFTPSGDVWVDSCNARRLYLFLANSATVVHGTTVHTLAPGTPFSSNAGCGLTQIDGSHRS